MEFESISAIEIIAAGIITVTSIMVYLTAYRLEMIQGQNREIIANLELIRHNTSISADYHNEQ